MIKKARTAAAPPPGRLQVETLGSVGRIAIDNPGRHNALSLAMWEAIPEAVASLDGNPEIRAIVLTGAEGGAFAPRRSKYPQARPPTPPRPPPTRRPMPPPSRRSARPRSRRSR